MYELNTKQLEKKEQTMVSYKQDKYIPNSEKIKMGRPRIENKSITVSFSISKLQLQELNVEIEKAGISRSKFLKQLLFTNGIISNELTPTEELLNKNI